MLQFVHQLMAWVGEHPHWAGVIVASIACAEALAFVGLLVPGATLMIGAGALVGVGALGFWSTLAWAVAGAVLGDGVSYWIGHRYKESLRAVRPLRERPQLLGRGEAFFEQHGGKSVFLARFIGPVRPIVPVVAGMLGMSPPRFYLYNLLSALAWAPAHLLPGMAFGASLALAGQVAVRLALLLGALLVFAWLTLWLARALYRTLQRHAAQWATGALLWAQRHRAFSWLIGDVLDPRRPVPRALLAWLAVLVAAGWLFLGVLQDIVAGDPLVYAGQSLHHLLQHLRTPLGDRLLIAVTELGDLSVALPVILVVLAWLLWRGAARDAAYWLAAVSFGALSVAVVKAGIPHLGGSAAAAQGHAFPSGHTSMSTVIYGFLAVLVAPALREGWRWLPYALASVLIGAIAFSRLYLGAHWLADVAAGLALGTAWVAVLAIARRRHSELPFRIPGLAAVALAAFVGAGLWHVYGNLEDDLQRYAVRSVAREMHASAWPRDGWRELPAFRRDLEGERRQPLNVQWAGDLALLRGRLLSAGWHAPLALTPRAALYWLQPGASLEQLPVPPQLNDGRAEALLLVRRAAPGMDPGTQLVLRLWPTSIRLEPGGTPLWVGTVSWQRLRRLPFLSFPRTDDHYDQAVA
ncbi:MAG: VTT domain-containing protein, partial [Betaproteobacteria bacterium]|nr:VTT domain-containing protein [Betaproteobacteria bacterium]